jgi:serine/threonine protein kinase
MEYADVYQCDLALVINNETIAEHVKAYYCACVYSALAALHDNAVLHRFINSTSVLITEKGVPKVCLLRCYF